MFIEDDGVPLSSLPFFVILVELPEVEFVRFADELGSVDSRVDFEGSEVDDPVTVAARVSCLPALGSVNSTGFIERFSVGGVCIPDTCTAFGFGEIVCAAEDVERVAEDV